jgi:GNAT superfamily N-acetyltransferase
LNHDLMTAAQCYGLYNDKNDIVGFIGIYHLPHPRNKKIKKVTRLVILPEYQGIGLGIRFLNEIAKMYVAKGWDFVIQTSARNLIMSLKKSDNWILARYGFGGRVSSTTAIIEYKRLNVKTASFFYNRQRGDQNGEA